jgi:hypothetical protein
MRIARLLMPTLVLAVLAGCGSSNGSSGYGGHPATAPAGGVAQACADSVPGTEQLRVTSVSCEVGRGIVSGWSGTPDCAPPAGASRSSCGVEGYRCLGTATDAGLAVSCAGPGRSISFLVRRG